MLRDREASEALVDGLKSLRGLLLVVELLFSPRLTIVPVRKPFWIPTDEGPGAGSASSSR